MMKLLYALFLIMSFASLSAMEDSRLQEQDNDIQQQLLQITHESASSNNFVEQLAMQNLFQSRDGEEIVPENVSEFQSEWDGIEALIDGNESINPEMQVEGRPSTEHSERYQNPFNKPKKKIIKKETNIRNTIPYKSIIHMLKRKPKFPKDQEK